MPSREELFHFPWKHLDWLLVNEGEAEVLLKSLRYRQKHENRAPKDSSQSRNHEQGQGTRSHRFSHTSSAAEDDEEETPDVELQDDSARPYIVMSTGVSSSEKYQPIWTAYSTIKRLHVHRHFSEHTNIVCTLGTLGVIVLIHDQQECLYVEAAEMEGAVGGGEDVIRDMMNAEDCFAGYFVRGLMQMYEQGVSPIGLREAGDLMRVCLTVSSCFWVS